MIFRRYNATCSDIYRIGAANKPLCRIDKTTSTATTTSTKILRCARGITTSTTTADNKNMRIGPD